MAETGRDRASAVYAIADLEVLGATGLPAAVETMAAAGIHWIQIRAKRATDLELYRLVESCCRRLEGSGVALWVDDRADVAACLPVRGVHVGQRDLPPAAVRAV
ncbi:MAG: thiamine phosphate synthase, partial [Acidobacteria bacterium]|nr:thiamine phosphate synthase [Acidobacteriota bacterium]